MLKLRKMQEIAEKFIEHKIDVTALQEIRWKGHGEIRKKYYSMYYSVNPNRDLVELDSS